jgi:hypothetical protein
VVFSETAPVSGNFYIELKEIASKLTDIAVASSEESPAGTAYAYKNQQWLPMEEVDPEGRKISMNIVPTFTYDFTTGINEIQTETGVVLYPNPVDGYLNIRSDAPIEKIVVQNMQGHQVRVFDAGNRKEITVPLSDLTSGSYLLKIQTKSGNLNHKIIKK